MKVGVNELADAVLRELNEHQQEVTDNLKDECKQTAKECRKEIQQNSPVRTGSYKKSWSVKVNYEGKEDIRLTVYNRKYYQLTHLLENGHAGKGGTSEGAAPPFPHIAPAEKHAAEKLMKKVKVVARKK